MIINDQIKAPETETTDEFTAYIKTLFNKRNPRRWWMVTRQADILDNQQFDLLFFRDLEDLFLVDSPENHRHKMLVPLLQYTKYIDINPDHTDALIEGYLSDNCSELDIHYSPKTAINLIKCDPAKAQLTNDEVCSESFLYSDLVPIYLVNKPRALEDIPDDSIIEAELYVLCEHTEFIELVFRSYSLFVEYEKFAKDGFSKVWQDYLTLMQENPTAPNIEEIHRAYWFSLCPEISNLTNSATSFN